MCQALAVGGDCGGLATSDRGWVVLQDGRGGCHWGQTLVMRVPDVNLDVAQGARLQAAPSHPKTPPCVNLAGPLPRHQTGAPSTLLEAPLPTWQPNPVGSQAPVTRPTPSPWEGSVCCFLPPPPVRAPSCVHLPPPTPPQAEVAQSWPLLCPNRGEGHCVLLD